MTDLDVFTNSDPTRRVKGADCPVLVFAGSKGGVGTSTLALTAAELAAGPGGVGRVLLVDAVTSRSDIRHWLRLPESAASLSSAVVSGDVTRAVLQPGELNKLRPSSVDDVSFGAVLSPETGSTASGRLEAAHVLDTVRALRRIADLVIVDAGVVSTEISSFSGAVFSALMNEGAYVTIVANPDYASTKNLAEILRFVKTNVRVNRERVTLIANRAEKWFSDDNWATWAGRVRELCIPVGIVGAEPDLVGKLTSQGSLPTRHKLLAPLLATVLLRVTGRPSFEPIAAAREALASETEVPVDATEMAGLPPAPKARRALAWRSR